MNFKKYHVSRNLIKYPYSDKSGNVNNVQWTVSENGHIKGVGTTDGGTNFFFNRKVFFRAGTYTLKIYGMHEGMTLRIYDSINLISIAAIPSSSRDDYTTFTLNADTSNNCRIYFNIGQAGVSVNIDCDIMLNEGSTPLPYEPYSSEVWHDTPHYIHNTSTDTITTLPADIYPTGTTATVGLKGNEQHTGTPTPDNPIMPQGTGERTGNVLDYTTVENTSTATATQISGGISVSGQYYVQFKTVKFTVGSSYTMSWTAKTVSGTVTTMWRFRYSDNTYSSMPSSGGSLVAEKEVTALLLYVNASSTASGVAELTNIMLNSGSAALPYEPYGYFIEIEVS